MSWPTQNDLSRIYFNMFVRELGYRRWEVGEGEHDSLINVVNLNIYLVILNIDISSGKFFQIFSQNKNI